MGSKSSKKHLSNVKNLQRSVSDDCVIPPPPQKHILSSYTLSNHANKRDISDYVEWQPRGEKVQHAEKVKTEHLFDRSHDCWDVHTPHHLAHIASNIRFMDPQQWHAAQSHCAIDGS
jgi:hypothetical protein